jgi:CheY-like chemotaxis protein
MTANAFSEDVIHAKEAGMNDHIAKPIEMNVFLPVIAKYL